MKKSIAAIAALPLLAALAASCGREVKSPTPRSEQIRGWYAQAQELEAAKDSVTAEQRYQWAATASDELIGSLAPGDPLLPQLEEIRRNSFAALARVKEVRRRESVGGANLPPPLGADNKFASRNAEGGPYLTPPVQAYRAEAPKPPAQPAPGSGETDPAPPTTPPTATATTPTPGETPRPPDTGEKPKDPEPPKEIRITKAVLKDGKVALIYWTFRNTRTDKQMSFGAPAGKVLSRTGMPVATIRHTYKADTFKLNPADPAACEGTLLVPDSFTLAPGESRDLVTVGVISENAARQFSGAGIELRMNDGDLGDQCSEMVAE